MSMRSSQVCVSCYSRVLNNSTGLKGKYVLRCLLACFAATWHIIAKPWWIERGQVRSFDCVPRSQLNQADQPCISFATFRSRDVHYQAELLPSEKSFILPPFEPGQPNLGILRPVFSPAYR